MATIASNASNLKLFFGDGNTKAFDLDVAAEHINYVKSFVTGTAGVTDYTIVSGVPAAGDVQFQGSDGSPAKTLTFEAAPAADSIVLVEVIPAGTL